MGNNYKFDIIKIPVPIIIYSDYSYDILRAMFQSTDVMISNEIENMGKNEEEKITFQLLFDDSDLPCVKTLLNTWASVDEKNNTLTIKEDFEEYSITAMIFKSFLEKNSPVFILKSMIPKRIVRKNIIEFESVITKIR